MILLIYFDLVYYYGFSGDVPNCHLPSREKCSACLWCTQVAFTSGEKFSVCCHVSTAVYLQDRSVAHAGDVPTSRLPPKEKCRAYPTFSLRLHSSLNPIICSHRFWKYDIALNVTILRSIVSYYWTGSVQHRTLSSYRPLKRTVDCGGQF